MMVQDLSLVFLLILYLLPICCCIPESAPTSGPFKTSIASVRDCKKPTKPYAKNPPIIFYPLVENVDGKNVLRGNLTILRDTKDVRIKLKIFEWRNNQWHQSHMFNNLNCHGLLIHLTFATMNVKYDKRNCMFFKGVYFLRDLDVNQMQHIWVPTLSYGKMLWRSEAYSNTETFVCKEYDTTTEPAYYALI